MSVPSLKCWLVMSLLWPAAELPLCSRFFIDRRGETRSDGHMNPTTRTTQLTLLAKLAYAERQYGTGCDYYLAAAEQMMDIRDAQEYLQAARTLQALLEQHVLPNMLKTDSKGPTRCH